jgi:restriction system protein
VFGALISLLGQRKRSHLHETVARQPAAAAALNNMSWREFEMLVGEAFRRRGFSVAETGGAADGGVDIVLTQGGETYLVQCKQWKAFKVGVNIVRELYGVMAAQGAAGGFVVTSGVFTEDARRFAAGRNIELVDGVQLHAMIRGVQPPVQARPNDPPSDAQKTATATLNPPPESTPPACPVCGRTMVTRKSKTGRNPGNSFWGCPAFPSCRGTRPF